jgi:hypothetical protein
MLLFVALIESARQKCEFYPMKKAGLHGRINVETSWLLVQQACKGRQAFEIRCVQMTFIPHDEPERFQISK